MQSFSQRKGLKPIKSIMQIDSMDDDLRNGLWNALEVYYWVHGRTYNVHSISDHPGLELLLHWIWLNFFKRPIDTIEEFWESARLVLRNWFFKSSWDEVYSFIEFIANSSPDDFDADEFTQFCNIVLEREMSAYRFVDRRLVQLTTEEEIAEIEEAINAPTALKPVSTHLKTAIALLADKTSTDRDSVYRNSIKESISAVESACNLITGGKDTLGDALKKVETSVAIHPALKKGFGSIYGYTNDASGIRHGLLDEPNLDFEDAKYMLVSCSAFINYLISKAAKAGITF